MPDILCYHKVLEIQRRTTDLRGKENRNFKMGSYRVFFFFDDLRSHAFPSAACFDFEREASITFLCPL